MNIEPAQTSARVHPLAYRMVVIAFINQNAAIACIWGSFSVLLTFVETRLGVGRELSTLGAPAVNLACAITAPIIGMLAVRFPLKLLMLLGSVLGLAAFVLLAVGNNIVLYLIAYGLLLGPAMAISVVLPATLVTRWFASNAGRALGIINTQLLIVFIPLTATWIVHAYGLPVTYLALAGLMAVCVIANLFVIERPPGATAPDTATAHNAPAPPAADTLSMGQLVASPALWGLALAYIANSTATVILVAQLVPLARSWGMLTAQAAILLSVQSLAGLVGTNFFGWLADRLGGARTLSIILFDAAILWILMLLHPSFPAAVAIIALFGMHSAGVGPVGSLAFAQSFGQRNFSSAFGLVNLLNLPFSVLCVPAAAFVYTHTGSYSGAIAGMVIFLGFSCLTPFVAWKRKVELVAN